MAPACCSASMFCNMHQYRRNAMYSQRAGRQLKADYRCPPCLCTSSTSSTTTCARVIACEQRKSAARLLSTYLWRLGHLRHGAHKADPLLLIALKRLQNRTSRHRCHVTTSDSQHVEQILLAMRCGLCQGRPANDQVQPTRNESKNSHDIATRTSASDHSRCSQLLSGMSQCGGLLRPRALHSD